MAKRAAKKRPANKIILGLQQAVEHATHARSYGEGEAAGRAAMRSEIDAELIEGLIASLKVHGSALFITRPMADALLRKLEEKPASAIQYHWRALEKPEAA